MPSFSSCLSSKVVKEERLSRDSHEILLDEDGSKPGCPFCNVTRERGFDVVLETPRLIAFRDKSPQSEVHLLVIPKRHEVSTVKDLTKEHVPLLRHMARLGLQLVPDTRKMGFHIPPFSSVHHLHLHVFAGRPTLLGRLKYPQRDHGKGKGWSWFVSADQAISILQSGGRIGLSSTR